MARNAVRAILLPALMLTLAACSSGSSKVAAVNPNVYPAQYKQQIIATLRTIFEKNETATVSGALISPPVLTPVGNDQRYTLCVRYTAYGVGHDISGGATRRAYFFSGQLNQLIPITGDECAGVAYQPFEELNRLCLGQACERKPKRSFMGVF